ncbi:unnamed protein product [Orchesella dallaii]|uniref:Uncharacterized protein n=1 Tax=Orchesella dallaii TaxID=48710 RepID=A0ABP1QWX8_9HEXA
MAGMISIVSKYVLLPGVFAYALMNIFKPSEQEIETIKNFNKTNSQFSQVLKAAASPDAKPMYRQKPGELHPLPELAKGAKD